MMERLRRKGYLTRTLGGSVSPFVSYLDRLAADQSDPDAARVIGGMGHADSVADVLAGNRRQFGGEFLLGWNLRNRSASRFATYLEELRRTEGP